MNALEFYVKGLFQSTPDTPENRQRQKELLARLQVQVNDWMIAGVDEKTACERALASIGDPAEMIREMTGVRKRVHTRRLQMRFSWALAALVMVEVLFCLGLRAIQMPSGIGKYTLFGILASLIGVCIWPLIATLLYRRGGDWMEWEDFAFTSEIRLSLIIWGSVSLGLILLNIILYITNITQSFWCLYLVLGAANLPASAIIYRWLFDMELPVQSKITGQTGKMQRIRS